MATYVAEALNDPTKFFQAIAYAGDGNTTQAITANFQVDLSWIKHRSTTAAHTIQDSVRGWDASYKLSSNENDAENDASGATWENYGHVSAVSSSSFTVTRGANTPYQTNASGINYIAWHWKESADSGMDIVLYTGNGSARTISHSLSAVPTMMFVKKRDSGGSVESWCVYHKQVEETNYLRLDSTAATDDQSDRWNDTAPTSSVFSVGDSDEVNRNTSTYVNYLFTPKQGFSATGSYTGNGNADGAFVYTGFRPAFVMIKRQDSTNGWFIMDDQRVGFNSATTNSASLGNVELNPNTNRSEASGNTNMMDLLSNGFKCRQSGTDSNNSGGTYIYIAFAKAPFVNSKGVPCNAR